MATVPIPVSECKFCGAQRSYIRTPDKKILCRACGEIIEKPTMRLVGGERVSTGEEPQVVLANLNSPINKITLGDVDGDFTKEVIAATYKFNVPIFKFVYTPEKSELAKYRLRGLQLSAEALKMIGYDINGDASDEVIVLDANCLLRIKNYHKGMFQGKILTKSFTISSFMNPTEPAIALIDNTNTLKILNFNGIELYSLPLKLPSNATITHIESGDFDGDGDEELFIVQSDRFVKYIDFDIPPEKKKAKKRELFVKDIEDFFENVIAFMPIDLDKDIKYELIVGSKYGDIVCYKFGLDGPLWTTKLSTDGKKYKLVSVSHGDPNNDSLVEIVTILNNGKVNLLSEDGDIFDEYKVELLDGEKIMDGVVGDADNDGIDEVIVATNKGRLIMLNLT